MRRILQVALVSCVVLQGLLVPHTAGAQSTPPLLANGETISQALENFASGTYTPGEALVSAQAEYWQQREAGATDSAAQSVADQQVPPSTYSSLTQPASTTVTPGIERAADYVLLGGGTPSLQDLWNSLTSLPSDGSQAAQAGGELLDAATGDSGAIGAAETGTEVCVGSAGVACGAAGVLVVGAVAYGIINEVTSGSSGLPFGCGTQSGCASDQFLVTNLQRVWIPQGTNSQFGGSCGGGNNSWGGSWPSSVSPFYEAQGGMGFGYPPISCGLSGVYALAVQGNLADADGSNSGTAVDSGKFMVETGWIEGSVQEGGTFQTGCPGKFGGGFLDDPKLPDFTLGTAQAGYAGAGTALQPTGWTMVEQTGVTSSCVGSPPYFAGTLMQPGSALRTSLPESVNCQGISCTNVTLNPPVFTPAQLGQKLALPQYSNGAQLLCSLDGCTSSNGNPVQAPGQVQMPDCTGMTVAACQAVYQNDGFNGTVTSTQGTCDEQGSGAAGDIVSETPAGGSYVDTSQGLSVVTNPSPLCIALPAPSNVETASQYANDLEKAGFPPPSLQPVTPENEDPTKPANAPLRVLAPPENDLAAPPDLVVPPGKLLAPTTPLTIQENPPDAPQPVTTVPPSGPVAPSPPGITVPSAPTPCAVFPFGIPCWISNQLGQFSGSAVAPDIEIPMPGLLGGGNLSLDLGSTVLGVDPSSIMATIRPVLLIASFVGIVLWLGGMAMGGSTGGGGSASEDSSE